MQNTNREKGRLIAVSHFNGEIYSGLPVDSGVCGTTVAINCPASWELITFTELFGGLFAGGFVTGGGTLGGICWTLFCR
uniref:Uncharacterized protein n=1 Tax=Romanomermis culicivorax TaxID=13658 RepID=A0A915HV86_ROMCU